MGVSASVVKGMTMVWAHGGGVSLMKKQAGVVMTKSICVGEDNVVLVH